MHTICTACNGCHHKLQRPSPFSCLTQALMRSSVLSSSLSSSSASPQKEPSSSRACRLHPAQLQGAILGAAQVQYTPWHADSSPCTATPDMSVVRQLIVEGARHLQPELWAILADDGFLDDRLMGLPSLL